MISVAIVGVSGYVGGELARLLARHPHVRVVSVVSETFAGKPLKSVFAGLAGSGVGELVCEHGGIEALGSDGYKDQAEMLTAFKASGARLACLCSSDKVYAEQGADAAKALTAAGATVHLAGRPGEIEAALQDAGVKTFVFMGCDVVATLQAAHDILGVK